MSKQLRRPNWLTIALTVGLAAAATGTTSVIALSKGEPAHLELAGGSASGLDLKQVAETTAPAAPMGEVTRIAYRAPAVSNLHPADARLALPEGRYSYPLCKAVVHASVTGALREAHDGLHRLTGARVGTQQLMQITVDAARDVRDFYAQHPVPQPVTRAGPAPQDLLVLSIDATGINMIDSGLRDAAPARDQGPWPPSAQLACRERTGRTRMAVVTAVYDAAPAVRDTADIMPPTRPNAPLDGPARKPSTGNSTRRSSIPPSRW